MSLLLAGALFCGLTASDIKQNAKHEVMNVTAYTSSLKDTGKRKGDPEYNITYSGVQAVKGVTVSAAKSIPIGTKVYIPYFDDLDGWNNSGVFEVQDRGGAITEGHMDVYMNTEKEANDFGRKPRLDVYILGGCEDVGKDEEKDKSEESNEQSSIPEQTQSSYPVPVPVNRVADKYNSALVVLCTVCTEPLRIPRNLEADLLIAEAITCPTCRQRSLITKELKHNIVQY